MGGIILNWALGGHTCVFRETDELLYPLSMHEYLQCQGAFHAFRPQDLWSGASVLAGVDIAYNIHVGVPGKNMYTSAHGYLGL